MLGHKSDPRFAPLTPDARASFVGDPALWFQPGDCREFPGDRDFGFALLDRWRSVRRLVTAPGLAGDQGGPETQLYVH